MGKGKRQGKKKDMQRNVAVLDKYDSKKCS